MVHFGGLLTYLLLALLNKANNIFVHAAEHKRIYYDRTVDRYATESKKNIVKKNLRTGNCVEKETETGTIELCLNLNNTYAESIHDVWVVKAEGGRISNIIK
uniref:Uncharacterized protein n=1 Tax=Chaetoceros debilis TaxID=122233 RepID=A0A7S3PYU4_9STRA|mmetsp:Transcript_4878/g.7141  ORF Transcript_4878/g.7141 Transcript_4878/m.7141 type:complete len:102 (+) Transcript_4878:175-480(+)